MHQNSGCDKRREAVGSQLAGNEYVSVAAGAAAAPAVAVVAAAAPAAVVGDAAPGVAPVYFAAVFGSILASLFF